MHKMFRNVRAVPRNCTIFVRDHILVRKIKYGLIFYDWYFMRVMTCAYAYWRLYSRVKVAAVIYKTTQNGMWKAPQALSRSLLPPSRCLVHFPSGNAMMLRSNPFISMGLSRVSEGPSTDDVIDVGRLMPSWACIWVERASERTQRREHVLLLARRRIPLVSSYG